MNYKSLVFKLGGLLNKRVYIFPFSRDIDTKLSNLTIYYDLLEECLQNKHVAVTLPEYNLSFKLKTIELCRNDASQAEKLIYIEDWLTNKCIDLIDESDEILSVKYQLVYSVGNQSTLDGNDLRWKIVEYILKLTKNNLKKLKTEYPNSVEYIEHENDLISFPLIRLKTKDAYEQLKINICSDFFKRIDLDEFDLLQYVEEDINYLTKFCIQKEVDFNIRSKIENLLGSADNLKDILLILRGLLTHDVLFSALNKRWKVEYGINSNRSLLQAVPFRAKDVPSER